MKINKYSITPDLENCNFIELFIFNTIYLNVLGKVKKAIFKIFLPKMHCI